MRIRGALSLLLVPAALLAGARTSGAQTLRGSPAAVDRAYREAHQHDLTFFRSAASVRRAAREGTLVQLRGNRNYRVHQVRYPYVLPTTHNFVNHLAEQYRARCGEKMVVTSGVRPLTFRLSNSVDKSVHPAGMAVDLRKPRNARCISWLRERLLHLEGEGAIDATEEHNPPHFHLVVYPHATLREVERKPKSEPVVSRSTKNEVKKSAPAVSARKSTSSRTYRVRRGDSLWSIARRHGTSVERLKSVNGIRSSHVVAGQVLVIPAKR